jgi:aspartyl-tRNA(Asn)/glutamyl-tRNA(Gln) amidotransferase subunit A
MLGISTGFEGRDYILAHQVRTKAMNHFHECFGAKKIDLIMIPTAQILAPKVPRAAHKHGQNDIKLTESAMMYCSLGNIAGIPGLNVPYGYSDNELPVGLQFMSAWWNEALLLRMAKACESLPDNPQKLPKQNWFSNEILK